MVSERAHKYFWVYVILVAALILGMIYFTSMTQQKEEEKYKAQEAETRQLASELDKEKNNSKQLSEQIDTGIAQSVQALQAENDSLKAELEQKKTEIIDFNEETLAYKNFCFFLAAYVNKNIDECKVLKDKINTKYLTGENIELYNKICEEIK
ncbi:MAG: hypothetical protein SPL89_01180 [Clostridia bacterium]|nr:hypothetical protein [Clostridia bacterium]